MISDGQTRNDMIGLFAGKLGGIRMKARPVVIGDIKFSDPIILDDLKLVREIAGDIQIKGIITGPYTLAMSCVDEHYGNTERLAYAFADALTKEAAIISDIVEIVQIDEPFFSIEYPEYGKALVETVLKDVGVEKVLHVCGDVTPLFEEFVEINVDILDHEFAANPELADSISEYDFPQKLGYGCVRSDIEEIETVEKIKERVKKGIALFSEDKLLLDPDCGLRCISRNAATQKLKNMVAAKEEVLNELAL